MKNQQHILLKELYEEFSGDIYRYAFSLLRDEEEAKDSVHEVFLRYFKNMDSFRGDCSNKTWLFTITRNYCFDRLKNKNFNHHKIDDPDINDTYQPDFEMKISLNDACKKLNEEENELIFLRDYAGYSYKEIAELTGYSRDNIKIKLFRSKQKLLKFLSE